jgi:hypothetical protein
MVAQAVAEMVAKDNLRVAQLHLDKVVQVVMVFA